MKLNAWPLLALTLCVPACDSADSPATDLQQIGEPSWQLVDFHRFTAPVGTAATNYVESRQTQQSLLPPPRHQPHPDLGIGPGAKHLDPYWTEFAEGVADAGYDEEDPYLPTDVNQGNGVWTVWMVIPRPGHHGFGSSPDYKLGPIIPHDVFPIHFSADVFRDGVQTSSHVEFDIPALDTIDPPFAVDGHSHIPMFLWSWWNGTAVPPGEEYVWHITMTDVTGAGWTVRVPTRYLQSSSLAAPGPGLGDLKARDSGGEALHVRAAGG